MKILLVHNFYGSSAPSGENTVYLAERDLLRAAGHEVIEFTRHSDEIRGRGGLGVLRGALSTPWNPFSLARLRETLQRERPQVMHVHNTFPLLSPAIFRAARGGGCATVLTLHNYRSFCASGIPERNGTPCTLCLDRKSVLPALRYGCYRNSRAATLPMAAMIALHRRLGTWQRDLDAFIALTSFQRELMVQAGLPARQVEVKPHFYADPPAPVPWSEREPKVVYIGRLGEYKGVHVLVEAWKRWGEGAPLLEIIGDGPERGRLEAQAAGEGGARIRFLGHLGFAETQGRLARASLLILPSLCFEGFPMVIREAFALGVPVAGSRLGSIPCIVEEGVTGVLFQPGAPQDLVAKVQPLWGDREALRRQGDAARRCFEREYTAEKNELRLMEIYRKALGHRQQRGVKG